MHIRVFLPFVFLKNFFEYGVTNVTNVTTHMTQGIQL